MREAEKSYEVGTGVRDLTRPLLLVDIDGVISLWGFEPNSRPAGTYASVEGVVHFLSEEAGRHLLALMSDLDPVWCSGWEEKANDHLPDVLGVPPLPHVVLDGDVQGGTSTPGHWKLGPVDAFAGPDRPLAWIDDAFNDACFAWADRRTAPTLLVETDPATGLVAEHAERVRAWARALG